MTIFTPADAAQLAEIISWAASGKTPLEIIGGGSKRTLGRPAATEDSVALNAISGIVDYEPSELVLTAKAATPLAEIEALLGENNQILAFEPPDWRHVLQSVGEPTLGGTIACNLAGPRRIRSGAARDHFLGFSAVNGFGEIWKAGGRVVKNVTGYDMCKLQAGAFGTLSVLVEVSMKVLPRPETSSTMILHGLDDATALTAMSRALNSPHEVSAAAHLPTGSAGRLGFLQAITCLRLEGPAPSVISRARALQSSFSGSELMNAEDNRALWSKIGAVQPLLNSAKDHLWRLNPPPSAAGKVLRDIQSSLSVTDAFYDWGGGLLWVAVAPDCSDAGATAIRAAIAGAGGTATLLRAPNELRQSMPVFPPVPAALNALIRRVKNAFDPLSILNPGRMWEGI